MYLKRLKFTNFKNYSEAELQLSPRINCFIGQNGAGKTNVLDAIYYLSFCKSYFNPIDSQNIRHKEEFFAIHGDYVRQQNAIDKVHCLLKRNQNKQFKLNEKKYNRLADHIGLIPLVMISPYDRDLINNGSEVRRKYIDGVVSQFDKKYLNDILDYNKVLLQRNTLLKHFAERRYFDEAALDIWNVKLAKLGHEVVAKRKAFVDEFIPIFQEYFKLISGGNETVELNYRSALCNSKMEDLLKENLAKDRVVRYTSVGAHKDDLDFLIDGFPIKKYGSQGQQKSYVIAIRLAQFEFMRKIKSYKPILLLDDVFDKLDMQRVKQLIRLVSEENFGQVFITDTQRERVERLFDATNLDHSLFEVVKGTVKEIGNGRI
ncbi:MAG: DNA replication/repair protein RecF [Bacteroidales bacterium]|nr:DNA replication/repair protein RecF [Bacteroidales bacterium]RLD38490.1 MAG: DNA replication and repair protein RecF [Bacteroidota bacterium]